MAGYPNFKKILHKRAQKIIKIKSDPRLMRGAWHYYKDRPVEYICDWGVTYDPRNAGTDIPTLMPFVPFKRQKEFIRFLYACLLDQENGGCEKCRDVGATWIAANFSDWLWRFHPGSAIGWGSRKESLVDKMGDPDSIFEKIRMVQENIPSFLQPKGWNSKVHATYMKIINPENGSTITGEAGDNIGRGGRKTIYFKDEAQPLTSKVLTPTGFKLMGDIEVGSIISHPYNGTSKVTQIKEFESVETFRFKFSDGMIAECSPNHLWEVTKTWGKKKKFITSAKALYEDYVYNSPGGQKQYKYRIPICDVIEFDSKEELPLDPYLVGALIGDGSVHKVPNATPGFTTADEFMVQEFERLLPEGVEIMNRGGYAYSICDVIGVKSNRFNKSRARKVVGDSGIGGCLSYQKFIPDAYKYSTPENRFDLLQGLMDTDGCGSGVASFHTSSEKLANDVLFLVQSLGGTATYNIKPNEMHRDMYVLHLALPKWPAPFRLERKIASLNPRKHPVGRAIISIELLEAQPMRCISVDSKDGLYLTDNFVVTHNSAHYERPEKIEAALGDNTNIQIDISSVNGPTTVFQRRIDAGEVWEPDSTPRKGATRVFIFDWSDHPLKTQEWYDTRRARAVEEGLLHIFAQEVDRDATAAVEGILIPGNWVTAIIDAHIKLNIPITGKKIAAFDVADGGEDKQGLSLRHGILQYISDKWDAPDVGVATQKALFRCKRERVTSLQYDNIGVGSGVKSEINRLEREKLLPKSLDVVGWNASGKVLKPNARVIRGDKQSPRNKDFYANLKAQGWWQLRLRCEKTFKMINQVAEYPVDELISLDSNMKGLQELRKELSQPTYSINGAGKLVIDKKPDGMKSPNRADATMMNYWPKHKRQVFI